VGFITFSSVQCRQGDGKSIRPGKSFQLSQGCLFKQVQEENEEANQRGKQITQVHPETKWCTFYLRTKCFSVLAILRRNTTCQKSSPTGLEMLYLTMMTIIY